MNTDVKLLNKLLANNISHHKSLQDMINMNSFYERQDYTTNINVIEHK
jgi:hypothetical protein